MSFAGDLWSSVNRYASQAKLNLKSLLVGTGDQVLGKAPGSLIIGQCASVTADSSGGSLKAGNIYQWNGSSWITGEGTAHSHSSESDGGTFRDVMIGSIQNTWFANFPGVTKSMFYQSGSGGTYADTISSTNAYIVASTSTTSASAANLRYGGFCYSFAYPAMFVVRIQLASTTTSSTARCGMNMESAEDVTNNKVKMGFEGCSTCNETYVSVISADGTTRSKNTQSTDNYATLSNYGMRLDSGVNVKYRKESGTIITKTTNVPASGVSDRANSWICGIQTSTTAARTLQLYGFSAVGQFGDTMPQI